MWASQDSTNLVKIKLMKKALPNHSGFYESKVDPLNCLINFNHSIWGRWGQVVIVSGWESEGRWFDPRDQGFNSWPLQATSKNVPSHSVPLMKIIFAKCTLKDLKIRSLKIQFITNNLNERLSILGESKSHLG